MNDIAVTASDLAAALDDVPAQARRLAKRREMVEQQHRTLADLTSRAVRVAVSGLAFDLGDGYFVRMTDAPTPRDAGYVQMLYVLPCSEWDVEDYHGGWAK